MESSPAPTPAPTPAFNTVQYCIDNTIPCFTLRLDETKVCTIPWSKITASNFTSYIKKSHNGFAVLTGQLYFVIDYDLKHSPPADIYGVLFDGCTAVEQTPGGYHFWFRTCPATAHLASSVNVLWATTRIPGLDIRANGGICYCSPTSYMSRRYTWIKGDLSTASTAPANILECILCPPIAAAATGPHDEIRTILNGLSQTRVDTYNTWICVGMALKDGGYTWDIWDEWSKRSSKYKPGECFRKWLSFGSHTRPVTLATLYYYLKDDNYPLFVSIQAPKHENRLVCATNLSIADIFYSMNPTKYMYSSVEGWYILNENNTWTATGSLDIASIPNIYNTISNQIKDLILEVIRTLDTNTEEGMLKQRAMGDVFKKISTSSFVKGVLVFLEGPYYVRDVETRMNQSRHLFAFTNGVLDMNTFTFRAIEPADYITITCGYEYKASTEEERTLAHTFLRKIWPNESVLAYNLAALAKSMTGNNFEQCFHVFTGRGANGKSCLMDLCKIVFGDYYQTFSVSYLTKESDGKDKPLPELAAARYARLLVTSEPDERDRFQISLLKILTGNEEVSFRGMYAKTPAKYIPQFKLWILTNDMPKLSKYDQAIERRMRCVHFPTRFVYNPSAENEEMRDDTLTQQFREDARWRYGLLGLLIDAAQEAAGRPLEMPREVREFTEEYMLENNPVGAWLRQHYEMTGRRDDVVQKTDLYTAFMDDTGVHMAQKVFYADVLKCGVNEKKDRTGVRLFCGLVAKN